MNENLRDRIAKVIHEAETPLHDHGQALAQAIIDDLGLEVKPVAFLMPGHIIIGRWEEHDE